MHGGYTSHVPGAVESFRQIAWLVFKWLLIAFSKLFGLVAVFWLGLLGYGWYTHDRHVKNIAFIISTERKDCEDDKFPIHLIVGNASEQTIEKVTFRFEADTLGEAATSHAFTPIVTTTSSNPRQAGAHLGPRRA